ncbi:MAG: hypothetical protein D6736_02720 [Nitrospinota bacterium]|nr:MAG: hypothetical protein D6736_02720 [Nitrospinota bacterium]
MKKNISWRDFFRSLVQAVRRQNPFDYGTSGKVIHRETSDYHHILVTEDGQSRYLRFDSSWQSGMFLTDPNRTNFVYNDYFFLSLVINPEIRTVLFIGLGGGSSPKKFHHDFPEMDIEVVEIDPAVLAIAQKYFYFTTDERLRVYIEDGRTFLEQQEKTYDLIVHDAYYSEAVPLHLMTREFFELVHRRLSPRGVVAFNLIGELSGYGSEMTRAVYKSWIDIFAQVFVFDIKDKRNKIFIGTRFPVSLSKDALVRRAGEMKKTRIKVPLLDAYAQRLYTRKIPTHDIPELTDALLEKDGAELHRLL